MYADPLFSFKFSYYFFICTLAELVGLDKFTTSFEVVDDFLANLLLNDILGEFWEVLLTPWHLLSTLFYSGISFIFIVGRDLRG